MAEVALRVGAAHLSQGASLIGSLADSAVGGTVYEHEHLPKNSGSRHP